MLYAVVPITTTRLHTLIPGYNGEKEPASIVKSDWGMCSNGRSALGRKSISISYCYYYDCFDFQHVYAVSAPLLIRVNQIDAA